MEKLKSMVPVPLRDIIANSGPDDLPSTCSALFDYLQPLDDFQHLVQQLGDPNATTCGKDPVAASKWKDEGNTAFAERDFQRALQCYTQALRCAPLSSDGIDKHMVATLHVNRASTMHKIGMLKESIKDCTRAIELYPSYSKAWYRRGQANADMKSYEHAIYDLRRALVFENSSSGKSKIRLEIESIMAQTKEANDALERQTTNKREDVDHEDNQVNLLGVAEVSRVSTAEKGWEIRAKNAVLPGYLVLHEEPYVAVILKQCRDTHCHFCFKELPGDSLPCKFCAIPLYCSENCRDRAGGSPCRSSETLSKQVSDGSYHRIANLSWFGNDLCGISPADPEDANWHEHKHECGGMSWAAVLPTEVVLAARMFIKFIEKQRSSEHSYNHSTSMLQSLCHHYVKMQPVDKLELHIFAIVLASCLQPSYSEVFQLTATSIPKLVLLIAQIKVNAMAIVHLSSPDPTHKSKNLKGFYGNIDNILCGVEQVRVAQAVYLRGSGFNHSCDPNVHASFISRSLLVHSIKHLPADSSLELCYGPQVGDMGLEDRQTCLAERYFFSCKCSGCSELNLSDLIFSAFQCTKPDCQGAVLDKAAMKQENTVKPDFKTYVNVFSQKLALPVDEWKKQSIDKVAHLLVASENGGMRHISPGHCLNCGSVRELERTKRVVNESLACLKRVQDKVRLLQSTRDETQALLCDALKSLQFLRSTLHTFNKNVANAEDVIAEILCLMAQPQSAISHCKASIQILEKLYHCDHIVIANELVKLVSIALSADKFTCAKKNLARIDFIFRNHYGPDYGKMFAYLKTFQRFNENIPR